MKELLLAAVLLQDPPPQPPPLPGPEEKPPAPADPAKELKDVWMKVIELCKADKKDEVQKTIAAMELSRTEMAAIFGEEKTAKVYGAYQKNWKERVLADAAADLVARCKKSAWYDVDVWCLNDTEEKQLTADDRGVLESLATKDVKVYNVRLKQMEKKDGLVLRCFVKSGEVQWKMGLKIGKNLAEK